MIEAEGKLNTAKGYLSKSQRGNVDYGTQKNLDKITKLLRNEIDRIAAILADPGLISDKAA